jgi:hypothetical protein
MGTGDPKLGGGLQRWPQPLIDDSFRAAFATQVVSARAEPCRTTQLLRGCRSRTDDATVDERDVCGVRCLAHRRIAVYRPCDPKLFVERYVLRWRRLQETDDVLVQLSRPVHTAEQMRQLLVGADSRWARDATRDARTLFPEVASGDYMTRFADLNPHIGREDLLTLLVPHTPMLRMPLFGESDVSSAWRRVGAFPVRGATSDADGCVVLSDGVTSDTTLVRLCTHVGDYELSEGVCCGVDWPQSARFLSVVASTHERASAECTVVTADGRSLRWPSDTRACTRQWILDRVVDMCKLEDSAARQTNERKTKAAGDSILTILSPTIVERTQDNKHSGVCSTFDVSVGGDVLSAVTLRCGPCAALAAATSTIVDDARVPVVTRVFTTDAGIRSGVPPMHGKHAVCAHPQLDSDARENLARVCCYFCADPPAEHNQRKAALCNMLFGLQHIARSVRPVPNVLLATSAHDVLWRAQLAAVLKLLPVRDGADTPFPEERIVVCSTDMVASSPDFKHLRVRNKCILPIVYHSAVINDARRCAFSVAHFHRQRFASLDELSQYCEPCDDATVTRNAPEVRIRMNDRLGALQVCGGDSSSAQFGDNLVLRCERRAWRNRRSALQLHTSDAFASLHGYVRPHTRCLLVHTPLGVGCVDVCEATDVRKLILSSVETLKTTTPLSEPLLMRPFPTLSEVDAILTACNAAAADAPLFRPPSTDT